MLEGRAKSRHHMLEGRAKSRLVLRSQHNFVPAIMHGGGGWGGGWGSTKCPIFRGEH